MDADAGDAELAEWVRRSREGDREAFGRIVARLARPLHARLVALLGDSHRAEDVLQETCWTAWRSIGRLEAGPAAEVASSFRRWLWTLARTAAVDASRHASRAKRGGGRRPAGESALSQVADERPTPARAAETAETARHAAEALARLPEAYREVVALRYLAGADHAEIARQLGLSNGALRGLLQRGMALLRDELSEP